MIVHPEIAALRDDPAPQREAQSIMARASEQWSESERAVLDALAALDRGAPLADLTALAALFAGADDAAQAFATGFVAAQVNALASAPLAHLAHRHFTDGTNSTLLLGRAGGVTLTLVAIDGAAHAQRPNPASVSCAPIESWDRVLAGGGSARILACVADGPQSVRITAEDIDLRPGTLIARDARNTALQWRAIAGRLVLLRLQRRRAVPEPVREYALADGRLIHTAAGSPRDSRLEMMVSLLGAMGRADAAPLLAEIAREPGAQALRWQALREGLGLDTGGGFAVLDAVARDAADPLGEAAATLRAHLLETYPPLRELA
ncbi:MAG: hypothetical protein KGM17_03805 [Sphingomonadales bacterium]|nr:hypothetical protein [Sphingomonadales bacterium]